MTWQKTVYPQGNDFVGMANCFFCGEVKHLLLDKRLRPSLPKEACYDKEPCDKCKEYMKQGIILISVQKDSSRSNPYRTGGWVVIKEEAVKKWPGFEQAVKQRVAFIEDEAWDKIGLPRGEIKNE